jgi:hypothetical protein
MYLPANLSNNAQMIRLRNRNMYVGPQCVTDTVIPRVSYEGEEGRIIDSLATSPPCSSIEDSGSRQVAFGKRLYFLMNV